MKNEKILLSTPHMSGHEMRFIEEAFKENWVAPLGPNVDGFEKELVDYLKDNSLYAVATSSGTGALHIVLQLIGVKPEDTIFCSSLTFIASANPIVYEKATPVFIDSEPESWNMCPIALHNALIAAKKKGKLPKAVIAVDLFGQSANYNKIAPLCKEYGVILIEDAAEALGAHLDGKMCGTFGDYAVLSFNGNKIITTSGGGMILTRSKEKADRAKFLITQARDPAPYYLHTVIGNNYRMSNIAAGIGRGQLMVLDERVKRRREIYQIYKNELEKSGLVTMMPSPTNSFANSWLSTITFNKKTDPLLILKKLAEKNIEVRPIWKPLHTQPVFKGVEYFSQEKRSFSDYVFENGLCLPSGSSLIDEQIYRVCSELKALL